MVWKLKSVISVVGLIMLMGVVLSAQAAGEYTVRHFDVSDGLSNEWIADIEQDEVGFLWIATQYGINRFDGTRFTPCTYRINFVLPTVISVQESQLTQRSLHISNRVDFQLADHDGFDRYMESWKGIQSSSPSANTFIDFLNEDDEIVLTLHFKNDDLEVQSDYSATPHPSVFRPMPSIRSR